MTPQEIAAQMMGPRPALGPGLVAPPVPPGTIAAMRGMSPQMLEQIGMTPERLQSMVGPQPALEPGIQAPLQAFIGKGHPGGFQRPTPAAVSRVTSPGDVQMMGSYYKDGQRWFGDKRVPETDTQGRPISRRTAQPNWEANWQGTRAPAGMSGQADEGFEDRPVSNTRADFLARQLAAQAPPPPANDLPVPATPQGPPIVPPTPALTRPWQASDRYSPPILAPADPVKADPYAPQKGGSAPFNPGSFSSTKFGGSANDVAKQILQGGGVRDESMKKRAALGMRAAKKRRVLPGV